MSVPILCTQRLRLEPLAAHHANLMLDYETRNREHLRPWEPARSESFYTLPSMQRETEKAANAAANDTAIRFAAFESDSDAMIALINLWEIRRGVMQCAALGYSVDLHYQGRGYATEAGRAVIDYAFGTMNLHRITTNYQPENSASGRVLRKLGFVVEGYACDHLFLNGAWRDSILVGLINENWKPPASQ